MSLSLEDALANVIGMRKRMSIQLIDWLARLKLEFEQRKTP